MLSMNIGRMGKQLLCALMIPMLLGTACFAETASETVTNAEKTRLTELGYLAEERASEEDAVEDAIRDFKIGNGISEEDNESAMALLMSENARSQSEYLSAKAQSLHEQGTLAMGAFGDPVKTMQSALAGLGYFEDECNGAFNETTEKAVKRFQLACGLNVTGIADSSVFLRLYEGEPADYAVFLNRMSCKNGDTGDNVRTLQEWLKKIGISGFSVTGNYGALTVNAVKSYQKSRSLEETGDADSVTVRCIAEDILQSETGSQNSEIQIDQETLAALLKDNDQEPGSGSKDQIKLELMKYQFRHGLPVTGKTDAETINELQNHVLPITRDEPIEKSVQQNIAKAAYAMIGTRVDFDSSYGFPEYINIQYGNELPKESEVRAEQLKDLNEAEAGDTVMVVETDRILWGVRAENGGVICEIDGTVVLYYPENGVNIFKVVRP